jgi:mannitol/fructose-specific phosphotransferase system IIA component (Ntr-type)
MLLLHNDKQHLFSLSYISKLLMNPGVLEKLASAKTVTDVHTILTSLPNDNGK